MPSKGNKGDSPTFVYLGEGYAKDKNMVWFETRPLDETSKEKVNVDVASFVVDKNGFAHDKNYTWEYGYVVPKGKNNAWLNGELVK